MKRQSILMMAMVVAALSLAGCGRGGDVIAAAPFEMPAKVDKNKESGIARLTLTPRAMERLGIETVEIKSSGKSTKAPYSALLYDASGGEWVYTNPEPNVFKRAAVKVSVIEGDSMVLAQGPAAGTKVVSVGAAELFGTEFEIGH
jgi:predicted small lipoprotein YifL